MPGTIQNTMAKPMTYSVATAADVPELVALVNSAYRGEESRKGWTTEADYIEGQRVDDAAVLARIADPENVILLVRDDSGELFGCCELLRRAGGKVAYFGLFTITPTKQGAGLGKQVLAWAERYAKESLGISMLEMTVIWLRSELIEWYQRRGYTKSGETRPFPYEQLGEGALRDDLYFEVLTKTL